MTLLLALPLAATLHALPPIRDDEPDVRMAPVTHASPNRPQPSIRDAGDAFGTSLARTAVGNVQTQPRGSSWASRHPVLVGTLVGLLGGFAIGYASGADGIFDDYSAEGNGIILGGIGAAAGAIVGWAAGR
jgi:hypothetical protein